MIRRLAAMLLTCVPLTFAGCGNPSGANIALRKDLQARDDQIATLNRQHTADQADLAAHRGPTTTSLSSETFATLYTTHGITLGRLTGGADLDPSKPGDDGLKIQVTPTDDDGQSLKAAGTFDVIAFDLQNSGETIGEWKFDAAAARANWYGSTLLYSYVLPCPWQDRVPVHSDITVRVTFTDALTGRQFTEQKQVHVIPPPANGPTHNASNVSASKPASMP